VLKEQTVLASVAELSTRDDSNLAQTAFLVVALAMNANLRVDQVIRFNARRVYRELLNMFKSFRLR